MSEQDDSSAAPDSAAASRGGVPQKSLEERLEEARARRAAKLAGRPAPAAPKQPTRPWLDEGQSEDAEDHLDPAARAVRIGQSEARRPREAEAADTPAKDAPENVVTPDFTARKSPSRKGDIPEEIAPPPEPPVARRKFDIAHDGPVFDDRGPEVPSNAPTGRTPPEPPVDRPDFEISHDDSVFDDSEPEVPSDAPTSPTPPEPTVARDDTDATGPEQGATLDRILPRRDAPGASPRPVPAPAGAVTVPDTQPAEADTVFDRVVPDIAPSEPPAPDATDAPTRAALRIEPPRPAFNVALVAAIALFLGAVVSNFDRLFGLPGAAETTATPALAEPSEVGAIAAPPVLNPPLAWDPTVLVPNDDTPRPSFGIADVLGTTPSNATPTLPDRGTERSLTGRPSIGRENFELPPSLNARIRIFTPPSVTETEVARVSDFLEAYRLDVGAVTPVTVPVLSHEVRYYHRADRTTARSLARLLGAAVRQYPPLEGPPLTGVVELWIAGT